MVTPTVNYSYYPAFVEYPGSTSLSLSVARDMLLDVVHGIAKFGPRRFYVINIGVSTNVPLAQAAALLALEGISFRYLDLSRSFGQGARETGGDAEARYPRGRNRDVDDARDRRVRGRHDEGDGRIHDGPHRKRTVLASSEEHAYNPFGIYGDATSATIAKGQFLLEGMTRIMLDEIEDLRRTPPLNPTPMYGDAGPPPGARPPLPAQAAQPSPAGGVQ